MTSSSSKLDPLIGTTLVGRYEVLSLVGSGGMGAVYKARNKHLDQMVCLKVLREEIFGETQQALLRLRTEAKALAALDHPNILKVNALESDGGRYFLVTEFIDGESLEAILEQGALAASRTKLLFMQISDALSYAHAKGIVHRDIKPSNLLITSLAGVETAKILDFGIAKMLDAQTMQRLTQTGAILGTPHYMAPEQCSASAVDARSDIYSLGCVLYECLTGKRPFDAESPMELMLQHMNATRPRAIEPLGAIALRAMQTDPNDRFQSAQDFRTALENPAEAGSPAPKRRRTKLKAGKPLIGVAACAAAALAATIWLRPTLPPQNQQLSENTNVMYSHMVRFRRTPGARKQDKFAAYTEALLKAATPNSYQYSEACQFKGVVCQARGDLDSANIWFRRSIESANAANRVNPHAVQELCYNLAKAGNQTQALELISSQLASVKRFTVDSESRAMLDTTMAWRLQDNKHYDKADRYLQEAIFLLPRQSPPQANALVEWALNTAHRGSFDEAITKLKQYKDANIAEASDSAAADLMDGAIAEITWMKDPSAGKPMLLQTQQILAAKTAARSQTSDNWLWGSLALGRLGLPIGIEYMKGKNYGAASQFLRSAVSAAIQTGDGRRAERAHALLQETESHLK